MNTDLEQYLAHFAPVYRGRREYGGVQIALATLNKAMGTHYRPHRLYEWLHEKRIIPARILRFVRQFNARETAKEKLDRFQIQ